jgi:hypothetical protein
VATWKPAAGSSSSSCRLYGLWKKASKGKLVLESTIGDDGVGSSSTGFTVFVKEPCHGKCCIQPLIGLKTGSSLPSPLLTLQSTLRGCCTLCRQQTDCRTATYQGNSCRLYDVPFNSANACGPGTANCQGEAVGNVFVLDMSDIAVLRWWWPSQSTKRSRTWTAAASSPDRDSPNKKRSFSEIHRQFHEKKSRT